MNKEIDQPNICFCAFHNCSVVCGECYLFKLKQDYTSRHIEHCHNIAMESLIKEPKQEIERGITITHVDKQETHICKYCGAETSQSDNECYAKPKQETLEEAAKNYAHKSFIWPLNKQGEKQSIPPGQLVPPGYAKHQKITTKHFINGAKWQINKQERSYSEEEAKKMAFNFYYDMSHKMGVSENLISENTTNVDEWFEQFKKK